MLILWSRRFIDPIRSHKRWAIVPSRTLFLQEDTRYISIGGRWLLSNYWTMFKNEREQSWNTIFLTSHRANWLLRLPEGAESWIGYRGREARLNKGLVWCRGFDCNGQTTISKVCWRKKRKNCVQLGGKRWITHEQNLSIPIAPKTVGLEGRGFLHVQSPSNPLNMKNPSPLPSI